MFVAVRLTFSFSFDSLVLCITLCTL